MNKERWTIIIGFLSLIVIGCEKENSLPTVQQLPLFEVYEPTYHRSEVEPNNFFEQTATNEITPFLAEVSGIVQGVKNDALVYMQEDSGNRAVVYAYNEKGKLKAEIILTGIQNRDWEDIAIGGGPESNQSYIYVGDFGDNNQMREELRIFRFEEPQIDTTLSEQKIYVDATTLKYSYPDGPKDAETLMINPFNNSLIIISKRDALVRVYELPFPHDEKEMVQAVFKGTLPFKTIVGGDISRDGKEILIKTYGEVYHWYTEFENPLLTLFHQRPTKCFYTPEVKGEAIGWTNQGDGYFTISETDNGRADPIIYKYTRK